MKRWNSPPGWPPPAAGWKPPTGWKPDPSWVPAPPGWQFWVQGPIHRRPVFVIPAVVVAVLLGIGVVAAPDQTVTAQPIAVTSTAVAGSCLQRFVSHVGGRLKPAPCYEGVAPTLNPEPLVEGKDGSCDLVP